MTYNIGLNIALNGVGWCVTDTDGRVIKRGGKHLYGTSRFDEANSSKERHFHRTERRRLGRKKYRLLDLRRIMAEEINLADPEFFTRLRQTSISRFEQNSSQPPVLKNLYKTLPKTIFTDGTYSVDIGKDHSSIYQIRKALAETDKAADIRYIYLAVAHILKSRGQFNEGSCADREDIEGYLTYAIKVINQNNHTCLPTDLNVIRYVCDLLEHHTELPDDLDTLYKKFNVSLAGKQTEVQNCQTKVQTEQTVVQSLMRLIFGKEIDVSVLLNKQPGLELSFANEDITRVMRHLDENEADLILALFDIYHWKKSKDIDSTSPTVSDIMIERYERHKTDLSLLKSWMKTYSTEQEYGLFFHDDHQPDNYNAYTRSRTEPAEYDKASWNHCTQTELYDRIRKILRKCESPEGKRQALEILEKMYDTNGNIIPNGFLPLQRISLNRDISNSMHRRELEAILDKQSEYHPCIAGNKEKILLLCSYRIPYYVGPMTQEDGKSPFKPWICYKTEGKEQGHIKPWTIDERIDLEATAESFIRNSIGECTYIDGEKVLPKHSLLYEEVILLDELNRVQVAYRHPELGEDGSAFKIHTELLPKEIKQQLIDEIFARYKHVSGDLVLKWLRTTDRYSGKEELALVSANGENKKRFRARLIARNDMERIFERRIRPDDLIANDLEKVILWSTTFEDRGFYRQKLLREYGNTFTEDQINQLAALKYEGWGKYSRKLLTIPYCTHHRKRESVYTVLRDSNLHFMKLYHAQRYHLKERIDAANPKPENNRLTYQVIADMPCAPSMKRAIWHSVRVLDEITGYMKEQPNAIYIRNVRDTNAKRTSEGKQEQTRHDKIEELYSIYEDATGKKIEPKLLKELALAQNDIDDIHYLYFRQLGRCMYSGQRIDLSKPNTYRISYIVPLGLMDDTSLDNQVLVLEDAEYRRDMEPMPERIVNAMEGYWDELNRCGLISGTKRYRLHLTEYDDKVLQSFLESQLTETNQIINRMTRLLKHYYTHTHVYGLNARLVDSFRKGISRKTKEGSPSPFTLPQCSRIQELNDLQDAYDAFLIAHIGSFADKYLWSTTNEETLWNIIRVKQALKDWKTDKNGIIFMTYCKDKPFEGQVESSWKDFRERAGYLEAVYNWHEGFVTYMPVENTGKYYRQTLYRKGTKNTIDHNEGSPSELYGGHITAYNAYMAIVSYKEGEKREKELVNVPVYVAARCRRDNNYLLTYLREKYPMWNDLKVLCDHIGKNQEILVSKKDGTRHPLYMKSATEAVNAKQLYIPPECKKTISAIIRTPVDDLVFQIESKSANAPKVTETLEFLIRKYRAEYALQPMLKKSLDMVADENGCLLAGNSNEKRDPLTVRDQVYLIQILLRCMNTQNQPIASLLKKIQAKHETDKGTRPLIEGDNRLTKKRIRGEDIIVNGKELKDTITLVDRSVTGIYTHLRYI